VTSPATRFGSAALVPVTSNTAIADGGSRPNAGYTDEEASRGEIEDDVVALDKCRRI
jgi:hypothetical protein